MKLLQQSTTTSQLADLGLSAQIVFGQLWRTEAQTCALQRRLVKLRRAYLSDRDPSLADALFELAFMLYKSSSGGLNEADMLLKEAHTILFSRSDSPLRAARTAHLRGNVNERLGNLQLAIELHEQAEMMYKRWNPLTWVRVANLTALASLYRKTRSLDSAGQCDRMAEDLHHILEMSSPRMLPA